MFKGKRDLTVLSNAALEIAKKLNAIAIITFSEELATMQTNIPVLVFKGGRLRMINHLANYINTKDKNIYERVEERARFSGEDISKASVIAFINDLIATQGIVVGIIRMNDYDSIIVYDLSTNDIIKKLMSCAERAQPKVIKAVLNIALQIATEGREGKLFGTGFIIGDSEEVLRRSHQLLLNPFEGHPEDNCNIVNPECWETVKSFAQLDGVFVITEDGIIKAAGRYLDIDAREVEVEKGLGGRHASAAAITRDTETIAITVSSSGGIIRVFKDGIEIVKIKPDIMLVK